MARTKQTARKEKITNDNVSSNNRPISKKPIEVPTPPRVMPTANPLYISSSDSEGEQDKCQVCSNFFAPWHLYPYSCDIEYNRCQFPASAKKKWCSECEKESNGIFECDSCLSGDRDCPCGAIMKRTDGFACYECCCEFCDSCIPEGSTLCRECKEKPKRKKVRRTLFPE